MSVTTLYLVKNTRLNSLEKMVAFSYVWICQFHIISHKGPCCSSQEHVQIEKLIIKK